MGLEIRDTIPAGGKKIEILPARQRQAPSTAPPSACSATSMNPERARLRLVAQRRLQQPQGRQQADVPRGPAGTTASSSSTPTGAPRPAQPAEDRRRDRAAPAPRRRRRRLHAGDPVSASGGGPAAATTPSSSSTWSAWAWQPWYGVAPRLDSDALPDATLLGGDDQRVVQLLRGADARLPADGQQHRHRQHQALRAGAPAVPHLLRWTASTPSTRTTTRCLAQHANQLGPALQPGAVHRLPRANGRSVPAAIGARLDTMSFLTRRLRPPRAAVRPDPNYGLHRAAARDGRRRASDFSVTLQRHDITRVHPARRREGRAGTSRSTPSRGRRPSTSPRARRRRSIGRRPARSRAPKRRLLALADPDRPRLAMASAAWRTSFATRRTAPDPRRPLRLEGREGEPAPPIGGCARQRHGRDLVRCSPPRSCQRGAADCRSDRHAAALDLRGRTAAPVALPVAGRRAGAAQPAQRLPGRCARLARARREPGRRSSAAGALHAGALRGLPRRRR